MKEIISSAITKKTRLFATDFDGTLCVNHRVSAQTSDAIVQFRENGGLFGVCSGRDEMTVKEELKRLSIDYDFLITMNGARIEVGEICLVKKRLQGYEKALPLLREICLFFSVLGDKEIHIYRKIAELSSVVSSESEREYVSKMEQCYTLRPQVEALAEVYQISCRTPSADTAVQLAQQLNALGLSAWPNCEYVDIVPDGVNKDQAVEAVAKHFGIAQEAVYTAGDGRNDMRMLSRFHGFAMEHAELCVRQAAERTANDVGAALTWILQQSGK